MEVFGNPLYNWNFHDMLRRNQTQSRQGARGGQGAHTVPERFLADVGRDGNLVDVTDQFDKSSLVQLVECYKGPIYGLGSPEIIVHGSKDDQNPTRVNVAFPVMNMKKGKPESGMWVTLVLSYTTLDSLSQTPLDLGLLKPNELTLLMPLIGDRYCMSPPALPYAKVVIAAGNTFILVKVIPEVTPERQKRLMEEVERDRKVAEKAQAVADKKSKAAQAKALADHRARLAQHELDSRRERDAIEVLTGLQCQALLRGFETLQDMQAADAEAERKQRQAAEAERQHLRREAERAEAAKKAAEAQQRRADKEAQDEADRLAKFGGKKGSPTPSSSSSRSASASPSRQALM